MAEPIFNDTVERVYGQLPGHYRDQDVLQGYQFKRYLAGLLQSQDDVNKVIERLQFIPLDDGGVAGDTSDLVDPMTADEKWLPWLGQLFGTTVAGEITDDTRTEVIRASGFKSGTTDSMIVAAQSVLVGSKKVKILKHSDDSWQPDMEEHIYRTNYAPRPNFVNKDEISSGGSATLAVDTSWAQFGSGSLSVTSTGNASAAAYIVSGSEANSNFVNFQPGEMYTISGYMRIPVVHTTAGANALARRLLVSYTKPDGSSNTSWATSDAAPNTVGVTRLSVTFTVPADADKIGVRAYNGSATAGDKIQFDGFLIEKTDSVLEYFDGSAGPLGGYSYRWLGDADASPSQQYIPAVENTATPWDMLIMTLQSETLKNLLNPTLTKTLSPSVWEDNYQSFGYDSKDVYKTLVDQPGVYQNRALAYYLKDPTWNASVSSTTGFGVGPFGSGTFGYGTDVTSKLRMMARSSFAVTPGDSYQYLVSLGLKQDVADEKHSAIGMQFYDDNDDVLTNDVATNLLPDPSFEYGVSGFVPTGSSTLTQSTDHIHTGANSLKVVSGTSGGTNDGSSTMTGVVTAGHTYTLSGWIYLPSANTNNRAGFTLRVGGTQVVNNAAVPVRDTWTFVQTTVTAGASGDAIAYVYSSDVVGEAVYYDDLALVEGFVPRDFNGDTPDPTDGSVIYQWNGTPGASTSSAIADVVSTDIDVVPTIENTNIASHNFVKSSKSLNYNPYGSNAAALGITNYGKYEGGDIIRATINSNATTDDFGIQAIPFYGLGAVSSGTTFTFSLDMYADANASVNNVRVFFRDDTNTDDDAVDFATTSPPSVVLTKGRWHTRSWTATVKANRTVTSAFIVVESSINQSQGAYLDTANWMLEEGVVANKYFNGNTSPDDTYTYYWDGVPNASITNKVLTTVAEENIVQMQQFSTRFLAPAGAVTARVFVDMDGFNGKDTLYIAQPGTREEYDQTWCAVSADPVQSIIDHNTKPAGIILHWKPIVSDWDTVTADGTRPWSELNLPWVNVEELGQ